MVREREVVLEVCQRKTIQIEWIPSLSERFTSNHLTTIFKSWVLNQS